MTSELYQRFGKDLVGILKTHSIPETALKTLPDRLEIDLTEGLLKGEVDKDVGENLLRRNQEVYSAVNLLVLDRSKNVVTGYDPFNQKIKIYTMH